MLKEYGITSSMSRRGNCWNNACSQTLFGSLKVERLHGQRFETRRQAKDEIIARLLWYSKARLHSTLAYVSPMRLEEKALRLSACSALICTSSTSSLKRWNCWHGARGARGSPPR